jgi:hypothetical protein
MGDEICDIIINLYLVEDKVFIVGKEVRPRSGRYVVFVKTLLNIRPLDGKRIEEFALGVLKKRIWSVRERT